MMAATDPLICLLSLALLLHTSMLLLLMAVTLLR